MEKLKIIKQGEYGVLNGKELEMFYYEDSYYLRSTNRQDNALEFSEVQGRGSLFIRKIAISDLEDAYEIVSHTHYKGYGFGIAGYNEKNQTVTLVTNNPKARDDLNLEAFGKAEFIKKVSIQEVEILEEKRSALGFD